MKFFTEITRWSFTLLFHGVHSHHREKKNSFWEFHANLYCGKNWPIGLGVHTRYWNILRLGEISSNRNGLPIWNIHFWFHSVSKSTTNSLRVSYVFDNQFFLLPLNGCSLKLARIHTISNTYKCISIAKFVTSKISKIWRSWDPTLWVTPTPDSSDSKNINWK